MKQEFPCLFYYHAEYCSKFMTLQFTFCSALILLHHLRAWYKTIVTISLYIMSYNSFALSPQFNLVVFINNLYIFFD